MCVGVLDIAEIIADTVFRFVAGELRCDISLDIACRNTDGTQKQSRRCGILYAIAFFCDKQEAFNRRHRVLGFRHSRGQRIDHMIGEVLCNTAGIFGIVQRFVIDHAVNLSAQKRLKGFCVCDVILNIDQRIIRTAHLTCFDKRFVSCRSCRIVQFRRHRFIDRKVKRIVLIGHLQIYDLFLLVLGDAVSVIDDDIVVLGRINHLRRITDGILHCTARKQIGKVYFLTVDPCSQTRFGKRLGIDDFQCKIAELFVESFILRQRRIETVFRDIVVILHHFIDFIHEVLPSVSIQRKIIFGEISQRISIVSAVKDRGFFILKQSCDIISDIRIDIHEGVIRHTLLIQRLMPILLLVERKISNRGIFCTLVECTGICNAVKVIDPSLSVCLLNGAVFLQGQLGVHL